MEPTKTAEELLTDYKKAALTVTTFMMLCYVLRYTAVILSRSVINSVIGGMSPSDAFMCRFGFSALFMQVLPSVLGYFLFRVKKNGGLKRLYHVPQRMGKAVANFPSVYGMGQIVNVLTIVVIFLITKENDLAESVNTVNAMQPPDIPSALFLLFDLAVIAPVFEEFMFRGLIMNALRPYGNGLSIFVSAVLFGIMHGNFNQLFYTAVFGIAMGYIANVTESLLPTTIIHSIINGISGLLLLFLTADPVQRFIMHGDTSEIPDGDMFVVAAFAIFVVCILILLVVGLFGAIGKIRRITRYKVKKVCPELPNGRKVLAMLCSVPAVITIICIIDTFFGISSALIG